jgi:DNA-binding NtrC family response regulator
LVISDYAALTDTIKIVKSTALLISRDAISLVVFRNALAEAGFEIEISTGTRNALSALESAEIKAIIIDCDDVDGGREFLSWAARKHSKNAVIVALTNHLTTLHEAFDLGATFVLQKPLNSERVTRCMRASSQLVAPQAQVN